jgi:PAS domain S-box-containing protein/putative nucleotidyltransferase with HDIG domain
MTADKQALESALLNFIDSAPVGIFRTRSDGQIELTNGAFMRMLGYTDTIALHSINAARLCADPRDSTVWMRELNLHGVVQHFETRLSRADGSTLWVELHGRALKDEQGHLEYFEGVAIDISQRKQAEEILVTLTNDLEASFEQTLSSLSGMIGKRDPYTAIHQRRVAHLAVAIGNELGLPEMQVRGIQYGALIHDIGKFFVPLEFLCCTGALGATEMELIRRHTCSGHEIVKNINSQWPIAEIVQQHHERLNGTGYPYGLSRRDILLESRIIAVADTVEAMAGHRPYRPSRGLDTALGEITAGLDRLYDTDISMACMRLFHEKGYEFTEIGKLPAAG